MLGTLIRLVWFTIVASAIAYVIFLVAGSLTNTDIFSSNPIVIRDVLGSGTHQLSGMLMVPSTCDDLSAQTQELSSTTYELVFQTWQESSVVCKNEETPREFHVVAFAPATGVQFLATLDGTGFPIVVVPETLTH